MFFLMFFAAFQLVLLYLYGRSVIAVDMFLNLVTTNPDEVNELLGSMGIIILVVCTMYLPPLVTAIIGCFKHWTLSNSSVLRLRRIGLLLTILGGISFILSFTGQRPFNPFNDIYPLNIADNIYRAVTRSARTANYHKTSSDFTFAAKSTRPADERELYVIVIGETSRAPQWNLLGYKRNNNEPLNGLSGLTAFRKVISESNTTHKSVPMLLSDVDATTFEDSIYTHKSIITAFKEAGFSTAFFSNQARNHSFIDFFGEEADTCVFIGEVSTRPDNQHHYDEELLSYLRNYLDNSKAVKQLIVLHTYGSHFKYSDRYPHNDAHFTPDSPLEVTAGTRSNLINAYDNTIAYTASVLRGVIDIISEQNSIGAMLYTSDHGEDIFDDNRELFLHASPKPSYYQIHVPMLVWISDALQTYDKSIGHALRQNSDRFVSSSSALFHSALNIAGIVSTTYYDASRSIASPQYKERPPIYLDDHNEGIPLSESGLRKIDFQKFDSLGIRY